MKKPPSLEERVKRASRIAGHPVGMNRRELLAHGIYASAGMVLAPTLLSRQAMAFGCGGGGPLPPPFMVFDMAGGAVLAGNCLVGKQGGPKDLLSSYDTLGWNPKDAGALDERFGLPMSAKASQLFQGLIGTVSTAAQANLRLASVCHFSQLDTSSNKSNIAGLVGAAGLVGTAVDKGFGIIASDSGGNSDVAAVLPGFKPVVASRVDDITGSASFGGTVLAGLPKEELSEIAARLRDLSVGQTSALQTKPGGDTLASLTGCVYGQGVAATTGAASQLDPRQDVNAQTVFGLSTVTAADDATAVAAAIITNAVNQTTGPGVWTLGDCDYHTGEQTKGDAQDLAMGQMIGRAIEYAHLVGKPLFFQLITDGSCASDPGTRNWSQDTNEGMTVFGYYSPAAVPQYITNGMMQIGAFVEGQTADRTTLVGGDPRLAALAVFANYCNIAGKMDAFNTLTGGAFGGQLDQILVFKGATA